MSDDIKIYGKLVNATTDNVLAGADLIYDSNQSKFLSEINKLIPKLEGGLIPSKYLPSYVDDVLEGRLIDEGTFEVTSGEPLQAGVIYLDTTTNISYRWSGSKYVKISSPLELGTEKGTALDGSEGVKDLKYAWRSYDFAIIELYKNSGEFIPLNIPTVDKNKPGLMSPPYLNTLLNLSSAEFRHVYIIPNGNEVLLKLLSANGSPIGATLDEESGSIIYPAIPAATTSAAGVMSASDKSIVNNASTLLSNSPLVDKLQFAVANNKRWLLYKNNGNSVFTGIPVPLFGEKILVIADYEATGKTDCTINLLALDDSVISSSSIPVVNDRHDGVMSTTLYRDLYETKSLAERLYNTAINTYDVGYNSDSVDVTLLTNGSDPIEANIESATTTKAGVMSSTDKTKLDTLDWYFEE